MSDRLNMDIHADVLEFLQAKFPEVIGSLPGWPRYDTMVQVNAGVSAAIDELFTGVNNGNVTDTAKAIIKSITALTGMAITLGIDVRPLWAAVHKARMNGDEADIPTLLSFQNPLPLIGPRAVD